MITTLTCHTPGCPNADQPIVMDLPEGLGAICGVCAQPIDDLMRDVPAPDWSKPRIVTWLQERGVTIADDSTLTVDELLAFAADLLDTP